MSVKERVLRAIDRRREEVIDFTKTLVKTPSENPPGDESKVAEVIIKRMRELGMDEVQVLSKAEHRPNILGYLKGVRERPILLLNAHTDTKPVGLREEWRVDPFSAEVIDGEMYGRGTADMKGAIAAMVYAAGCLKEAGVELPGTICLAMTADEEAGSDFGVNYLLREKGLKADAGIVCEPSGIDTCWDYLDLIVRGAVCFDIIVEGTQMHSSLSDIKGAVNAGLKLANVLSRMGKELKLTYKPHPLCPQGPTVNLADFLRGGVFYGVTSGQCVAGNDIRIIPSMSVESVMQDVERFLDKLRAEDPKLKVRTELKIKGRWAEISAEEPVVQATLRAAEEVLGFKPKLGCFPGGTDATPMIREGGFPVIPGFGPGLLWFCHGPNERIPVEDIVKATKIYALAALYYFHAA